MDKEAWKDQILNSLECIQKATPREGLFDDIERQIMSANAIIPIQQWRLAAAAALILLAANFWTIQQLVTASPTYSKEKVFSKAEKTTLISNYKLYE